jgi:hypothetical protein
MIHKHIQVQIYREYSIESLKQALANLQSYNTKGAEARIYDAMACINEMKEASKDE